MPPRAEPTTRPRRWPPVRRARLQRLLLLHNGVNHFEGVARVDARVDATLGAAAAAAGAAQGSGATAAGTLAAAGDAGTTWDSAAGGDEVVGAVADVLSDILAASKPSSIPAPLPPSWPCVASATLT